METSTESQSKTVSFAVKYENGHVNIHEYSDESGEDFMTIVKKIFKNQNYWPKKFSVDVGYIIKEISEEEIYLEGEN